MARLYVLQRSIQAEGDRVPLRLLKESGLDEIAPLVLGAAIPGARLTGPAHSPTELSVRASTIRKATNRVLYAATQRISCFVETLARFRPDLALIAELQAIAGEDAYVPLRYRAKRLVQAARDG